MNKNNSGKIFIVGVIGFFVLLILCLCCCCIWSWATTIDASRTNTTGDEDRTSISDNEEYLSDEDLVEDEDKEFDDEITDEDPAAENYTLSFETDGEPVIGDISTAEVVVLVTYDLECPGCKEFHESVLPSLRRDFIDSGKVALIIKDYPITSIHKNALNQAKASNCIYEYGGIEAYEDALGEIFAAEGKLTEPELKSLAIRLGIKEADYNFCFASRQTKAEIDEDISEVSGNGVYSTPFVLVGSVSIDGTFESSKISGSSYSDISSSINNYLEETKI